MWFESETPTLYKRQRNCSYLIILHYIPLSLSVWVRVLGLATLETYCNPPSFLHLYNVCILASLLHPRGFLPFASSCTPLSEIDLLPTTPIPPRPTPIKYRRSSSVIQQIRLAILWWNPSNTVIITSITTQLYLPLRSTVWTNGLYIITRYLIGASVLPITFSNIPHILWDLCRLL